MGEESPRFDFIRTIVDSIKIIKNDRRDDRHLFKKPREQTRMEQSRLKIESKLFNSLLLLCEVIHQFPDVYVSGRSIVDQSIQVLYLARQQHSTMTFTRVVRN